VRCAASVLLSGMAGLLWADPRAAFAASAVHLQLDDLAALHDVAEPTLAPDGSWVAFTVTQDDVPTDSRRTDIWVARPDGTQRRQLTHAEDDAATLRFSPNGKRLGFLSRRDGEHGRATLHLVDPLTGKVEVAVTLKGDVTDFAWAPDGRRLVLVSQDPVASTLMATPDGKPSPAPIVIDRFYFKEDVTGYLGNERRHLFLLDLERRTAESMTAGLYDEVKPSWSPDGRRIAFVSKRGPDPDRHDTFGIYIMEAALGAPQRLVATYQGSTYQGDAASDWASAPAWSPDGKSLAYVTAGDPKLIYYSVHQLAVVPVTGGSPRMLAPTLDRNVSLPHWSGDGRSIFALVEDDGNSHLVRFDVRTGSMTPLLPGRRSTTAFDLGRGDTLVVLDSTPTEPAELYAVTAGSRQAISQQNARLLGQVALGQVDEISWSSADGTLVHGFLTRPPEFAAGRPYPTLLHLHGGPTSQFDNGFDFEQQWLAAHGYLVVAPNPRGSAGRGQAYAAAIYADWGNKDAADVRAAIDALVERGLSDARRLGIGGWSYGGMLTNYVIARDSRFKAAVAGASESNILAGYGTDMYVREYEAELGRPWENLQTWLTISFPFLQAEHITTPTLFLCGSLDYAVPCLHSEQMYQALRSLNRDTRLVIYPGQSHYFVRPSFRRDRLKRELEWYDQHLRG
jgi:dipeptidyl aminopeptidase/acylaminoacyl peptidase